LDHEKRRRKSRKRLSKNGDETLTFLKTTHTISERDRPSGIYDSQDGPPLFREKFETVESPDIVEVKGIRNVTPCCD
jgi:hypothetical protein